MSRPKAKLKQVVKCTKCYDKGYSTVFRGSIIGSADFHGDKDFVLSPKQIVVNLCSCERGKELNKYFIKRVEN